MKIINTRRQFLKSSSALLLAGTSAAASSTSFAQNLSGEDYWQMVRNQFSFTEDAVPMNAANLCPAFRAVSEKNALLTADIDQDCSFNNRAKYGPMLETTRNLVANQLNVSADEIALVRNTSEANNLINNGLGLAPGDEVVIWDQNHPTNHVAWEVRAARFGLTVKKVTTPINPTGVDDLIDAFTAAFSASTKVLAITHVSNVSGIKLPAKEIIQAAHARGIYVHLDGAQTWGAMALDLKDLNPDSFSASAHKWYMGPKEVGLLYIKADNIDKVWPNVIAPGWGDTATTTLKGARKFESLGQRDDAALAALASAAEMHNLIGAGRIENRIVELSQRLKTGIRSAGHDLVTPMETQLSFGVCIIRVPAGQNDSLANALYTDFGIAAAGTGGIRLCPTIYNTYEHVDRAIRGVNALLG
ncbi:MAG: isopenicillin-N epimerase [Pseudohongiellaceae bacterium]|jgi:isopenicillin-N epimerase